jgi:uncharacterized protein (TIGR00369 family)
LPANLELKDNGRCFACGKSNPIGLKLVFQKEGEEYVTFYTPLPEHQGWQGITHGGLICTVLDEAMARLVWKEGLAAVTGELNVRLAKPAVTGQTLRIAGTIEEISSRLVLCRAKATNSSGETVAEATARMVRVKAQ